VGGSQRARGAEAGSRGLGRGGPRPVDGNPSHSAAWAVAPPAGAPTAPVVLTLIATLALAVPVGHGDPLPGQERASPEERRYSLDGILLHSRRVGLVRVASIERLQDEPPPRGGLVPRRPEPLAVARLAVEETWVGPEDEGCWYAVTPPPGADDALEEGDLVVVALSLWALEDDWVRAEWGRSAADRVARHLGSGPLHPRPYDGTNCWRVTAREDGFELRGFPGSEAGAQPLTAVRAAVDARLDALFPRLDVIYFAPRSSCELGLGGAGVRVLPSGELATGTLSRGDFWGSALETSDSWIDWGALREAEETSRFLELPFFCGESFEREWEPGLTLTLYTRDGANEVSLRNAWERERFREPEMRARCERALTILCALPAEALPEELRVFARSEDEDD